MIRTAGCTCSSMPEAGILKWEVLGVLYGKEVYRAIEITDDVQTAKLSPLDQIRLIIANLSNDDAAELDMIEKVSRDKLYKVAALSRFIEKAAERMDDLGKKSATVKMSSEFLPYIDEVLSDKDGYGRYYDFKVVKKDRPVGVKHFFILKITKRQTCSSVN